MGIHNINDRSNLPTHSNYPPIAASKVRHIEEQLARHKDWKGNHEVVISLLGKFTFQTSLSHLGVTKLRAQKFKIKYARQLTIKDNLADKYKKGLGFTL